MKKLRILSIFLLAILLLLSGCAATPPAETPHEATGNLQQAHNGENKDTQNDAAIPDDGDTPQTNTTAGDETPGTDAQTPQTPPADTTTGDETPGTDAQAPQDEFDERLPVYGESYYDLTNVVLYLDVYGELPPNYITKNEARTLGWEGGSVEPYQEGAAIGGDFFGNYEGILPTDHAQRYTECDIDTHGYHSRGSRRLVFSDDGRYFYTSDHYETFSEYSVTADYEVIPCA